MTPLDTLKLAGLWLAGLALVGCLALVAYGRRVKARIARSLSLSEAVWAAQDSRVSTPTDVNGGDDTAIQPVPVADGWVDPAGNPRWKLRHVPPEHAAGMQQTIEARSFWPVLDMPLIPPHEVNPLDPLDTGHGWWTGD